MIKMRPLITRIMPKWKGANSEWYCSPFLAEWPIARILGFSDDVRRAWDGIAGVWDDIPHFHDGIPALRERNPSLKNHGPRV